MDLGEKLTTIQEIIYAKAQNELLEAGINDTLAAVVMEGVFRRFQEAAYKEAMLHRLQEQTMTNETVEVHTGTPEELLNEIVEGAKNENVPGTNE